jgi:MFS family permease
VHAWAGGLPRAFWAVWTGTLVNRLGTFVEPFLALYLTIGRGLSVPTAGAIVALAGAGSVVSQPIGGHLADHLGRRVTLTGGMMASAACILLLAQAHAVWLLAVAAALVGVAGDLYRPAAQATIADVVPLEDRRRATGLVFWAINLGFSVAAVVGGLLAEGGYGLLFAVDAVTCAAYGLVVWRLVPETRPAAAEHDHSVGWHTIARDRVAMGFFAGTLGSATVYATIFTILPIAMHADGLGPSGYGAVIALNGIGIVVLQPPMQAPLLRARPAHALALASALVAVAMVLLAAAEGAALYGAAVVLVTVGEICAASSAAGIVAEIAPPALRGRYNGAWGLCWGLGFTLAPLVGAPLLGGGDAVTPWLAAAGLSVVVAGAMLTLSPAIERRRAVA